MAEQVAANPKASPQPVKGRPAPARVPEAKILRIGIIHGGRIIEERLIPAGQSVSVGEHPKSTLVVKGAPLPAKKFELFTARGSVYTLRYTDKMHGKIAVGDQVVTLAALASKGTAKTRGNLAELTLDSGNRGKIYVGEHTFLFQFVVPPPTPARARSSDFRGWRWEEVDWIFLGVLLLSALLHTAAVVWMESQPPPKKMRLEDLDPQFRQLVIPKEPEATPPPEATAGKSDEATPEEVAEATPEATPGAESAPEAEKPPELSEEEKRAQLEKQVSNTGLLALIGTAGEAGSSSAVSDLLSNSSSLSDDAAQALRDSSGVAIASRDVAKGGLRGGTGGDDAAGIGDLGGAGGDKGGAAAKEVKVPQAVLQDDVEIASSEDAQSVRATMKRYNGRIKACYEKELKTNPELVGKVTVSWVITTSGSVQDASLVSNTTNNGELASCILREVGRIKFPEPPEDIDVDGYSWTFSSQ
jgi:outer membrane biosynthesis protein TonB